MGQRSTELCDGVSEVNILPLTLFQICEGKWVRAERVPQCTRRSAGNQNGESEWAKPAVYHSVKHLIG